MEIEMSDGTMNQKLKSRTAETADAKVRVQRSAVIARFFDSRLRLSQLRVLVAVADLGQLKRVAEFLNVTPPAVSKQLAEFEDALGEPVLTRVGNRLEFTPVGELLVRRARDVLQQLERARAEVDELCSGAAGNVGVGAVPTVAPVLFPAIVSALRASAPNASMRLHEGRFAELAPMLLDGRLDVLFARDTTRASDEDVMRQVVMDDPLAVVCGAQHPIARTPKLAWSDLAGIPWILPLRGSTTFMHLESLLLRHDLALPRGSIESGSWNGSASVLRAHSFLALFPLAYARKFLDAQEIAILPLSTEGIQDTIEAVWRKDDASPLVPLLVESVRRMAALR
jgi:DNA-binding transcriptional LysR family regulator